MGGVGEQSVSFLQGLSHKSKFAVFQVADAAVNHVGGGGGGSGAEVFGVDEQNRNSLEGEVAERSDAVDTGPDDEHVGVWVIHEGAKPAP